MNIYDMAISPLEKAGFRREREKYIKQAHGKVLEIGVGTGANLPFYDYEQISELILTDANIKDIPLAVKKFNINADITILEADAEKLPFEDCCFDYVIATLLFCSLDAGRALEEVKRVLKSGGIFIFMEHVEPKNSLLKTTANIINPIWKKMANGCNLNRDFIKILSESRLEIIQINTFFNNICISGTALKK